ncbi:5-formyltetrahydrofolate cyclo-ligase [Oceanobacillus saliphilus]|uniref:5-formyltetrahydrofolate cyclo-ligase n=1 Tax=Oceanobacillus saliphilus TaxID=2925834 RepID=UPI00201D4B2B|nr:5-formyltetrahydrofolate cyclo-ligase [Oceanobacillus saliphilus]
MTTKKELRENAIQALKDLQENEKLEIENMLTNKLLSSSLWNMSDTIGITMSQGFEWSTKPIIEAAWDQKKKVCIPKCYPNDKKLIFYELESFEQLEIVYYNLLEPKTDVTKQIEKNSIDLLLVPGLIFDRNGYRIGFGGGYYDRFLTDYINVSVSLCSANQLVDYIPVEQFDIPVNYLILENAIISI